MIGILLVNLGTPDEPTTTAVRNYLRQFLSDPLVIDINPVLRSLLLNFIILPFRSPKSAAAYRKIWTDHGSPLYYNTRDLSLAVAKRLGEDYSVDFAMRYGRPSIESVLKKMVSRGVSELRVLPLYPQYASSSTGSTIAEVHRVMSSLDHQADFKILPAFYNNPGFISSFVKIGRPVMEGIDADHILFSFHGLPERHVRKGDPYGNYCLASGSCCAEINSRNENCYRAQCFETARLIAMQLRLKPEEYSVSFQSRLGRTPWIEPYTDLHLLELARSGKKKIAVFCPAFVADCLETLEEIGIRARESVVLLGAETLELVPSLNSHPKWVEAVCGMMR